MSEEIAYPIRGDVSDRSRGLALMRSEFPPHQVSKLPKGTKAQNECPSEQKRDCKVCGGWHHPSIRHVDYVGHAAMTNRLLDADPLWTWEPMAYTEHGLPRFDESGGLWIKLTVCGHTRIGYGHADKKQHMDAGAREKEVIGDALRNAAMRFGAALEFWHKGELHVDQDDGADGKNSESAEAMRVILAMLETAAEGGTAKLMEAFKAAPSSPAKVATWKEHGAGLKALAAARDDAA